MTFIEIIKALMALSGVIKQLIALFTKTPEQKRAQLVSDLHGAFQKAESSGDTSELEKIIRGGK